MWDSVTCRSLLNEEGHRLSGYQWRGESCKVRGRQIHERSQYNTRYRLAQHQQDSTISVQWDLNASQLARRHSGRKYAGSSSWRNASDGEQRATTTDTSGPRGETIAVSAVLVSRAKSS